MRWLYILIIRFWCGVVVAHIERGSTHRWSSGFSASRAVWLCIARPRRRYYTTYLHACEWGRRRNGCGTNSVRAYRTLSS